MNKAYHAGRSHRSLKPPKHRHERLPAALGVPVLSKTKTLAMMNAD